MIVKMLDISTAHIKQTTAVWIDENLKHDFIGYHKINPKGVYGWFIFVPEKQMIDDIDEFSPIPKDLLNIIKYACSKKCQWIMLDRDGDIINKLPTYIW